MNHTNVVDVKAWIDARPVSRFQWNVLLLCFIIIMLDGYDAAVMGFVAPALIEDALETLSGFVRTICPGAKTESAML